MTFVSPSGSYSSCVQVPQSNSLCIWWAPFSQSIFCYSKQLDSKFREYDWIWIWKYPLSI
jgi:hypothetical protein